MSALDVLRSDMVTCREALRRSEQLVGLLDYVEQMLNSHGRDFEITQPDDATLRIDIDLTDPQQIAPPPPVLALPPAEVANEGRVAPAPAADPPPKPASKPSHKVPKEKKKGKKTAAEKFVTGKISEAEMAIIHKMLDEGATGGQIARVLGRAPKALGVSLVRIRKQRAECVPPPAAQGCSAGSAAEECGCGQQDAAIAAPICSKGAQAQAAGKGCYAI